MGRNKSKQLDLLQWWYNNYPEEKFTPKNLHITYKEETDYDKTHQNTGKMMRSLADRTDGRPFLKRESGEYWISDRGKRKADFMANPGDYISREPQGYGELTDEILTFLEERCEKKINKAVLEGNELQISLEKIDRFNPELIDQCEEDPQTFIAAFEEALDKAADGDLKSYSLVPDFDYWDYPISRARNSSSYGKIKVLEGLVRTSRDLVSKIVSGVFECRQCGDRYEKEQSDGKIKSPYKCDCGSRQFDMEDEIMKDKKEFVLDSRKDQNTTIKAGYVTDNLLEREKDALSPGKRVRLLGTVVKDPSTEDKTDAKPYFKVLSVQQKEKGLSFDEIDEETKKKVQELIRETDNPFENLFAPSIAPEIAEMDLMKKGVAASLIGSTEVDSEGEYGRLHTIIYSNPGMGKSEIQNFIQNTFSNSYFAEAEQSSTTSLTVAATKKEGGQFELKAGKVVLADNGVLSIDEWDKWDQGERAAINTSMSQGFVEADKGGEMVKFPARSTIIATGNFEVELTNYDRPYQALPKQAQGVMDRFALKIAVTSQDTEEVHTAISEKFQEAVGQGETGSAGKENDLLSKEELVVYKNLVDQKSPMLTDEANERIADYIKAEQEVAEEKGNDISGTSNRFMTHLIKLTLMYARSRLVEKAERKDADRAVELYKECKQSMGMDIGEADIDIKTNRIRKKVLEKVKRKADAKEDDAAEIENIIAELDADESDIEASIKNLRDDGEIYDAEPGKVAPV
jgi:replicative DNA helicase Mcm